MKLHYFKSENGNFGDDLNPWLWNKLLPFEFDENEDEILYAIGTVLNHKMPKESVKYIFGSGFGYGEALKVDETWKVYALRGFRTAAKLGLDKRYVITDSALLVRNVIEPLEKEIGEVGFMPHHDSVNMADFENLCREAGIVYISPEESVDVIFEKLGNCKLLVAEAMHGAIVADALRIPWVPVVCYSHINEFKWGDWLDTVEISYNPIRMTAYFNPEWNNDFQKRLKNSMKRALREFNLGKGLFPPPPKRSSEKLRKQFVEELKAIRNNAKFYLSDEKKQNMLLGRYREALDKFICDYRSKHSD